MKLAFAIISFVFCVPLSEGNIPEDNSGVKGLYQGDILLNQQQEEALKSSKARAVGNRLWPGGVVPYALSQKITDSDGLVFLIDKAIAEWKRQTCIKLKPRSTEDGYILFTYGKGCFSYVGYQGRKQTLSLGPDCWIGTTTHEIGKASNFDKMTPGQQQSWMPFGTPYDYFSIMHFSPYAFTKDKKPTITPKNKKIPLHYIGQRDVISYLDLQQINLMYSCPGNLVDYADRICENQSRRITCYGGRKIKITYANYGRKYSFKCGFGFNTNCVSSSSFKKVSKTCNGRSSCLLQATDKRFDDPCPYTSNYLAIRFECHP